MKQKNFIFSSILLILVFCITACSTTNASSTANEKNDLYQISGETILQYLEKPENIQGFMSLDQGYDIYFKMRNEFFSQTNVADKKFSAVGYSFEKYKVGESYSRTTPFTIEISKDGKREILFGKINVSFDLTKEELTPKVTIEKATVMSSVRLNIVILSFGLLLAVLIYFVVEVLFNIFYKEKLFANNGRMFLKSSLWLLELLGIVIVGFLFFDYYQKIFISISGAIAGWVGGYIWYRLITDFIMSINKNVQKLDV